MDKITLGDQVLEKVKGKGWLLNNQMPVDEQMVRSLLSLMQQLEVKRPVPEEQRESIMNVFALNGIEVRVYQGDALTNSYLLAGDEEETYVMNTSDSEPYAVYIPGYFIKIRPLFDLVPDEWRDKTLLRLSWRTLKSFQINYTQTPDRNLQITFDDTFYRVENVEKLDSAKLYYYITDVARFKAEEFLQNDILRDSIASTKPFCSLKMQDIKRPEPQVLDIYTIEPRIYGILHPENQLVRISPKALGSFLVSPQDFERRE